MSLNVEALRAVRRIIVHANCPDGRASALILHAALPEVEVCEMAYGSPEHDGLVAEPGLLFCDFTPPKTRLAEFAAAGAIVLDHHERQLVEPFGARGVFGENEKGESGAVLALREVYVRTGRQYRAIRERDDAGSIARLVAIRDTWQRASSCWDSACAMSEALRFLPLDECLRRGVSGAFDLAVDLGPLLLKKKHATAEQAAATAVRTEIGGRRVAIVSSVTLTSDVSDVLGAEADLVVGFEYVQEPSRIRLQFSLRSRGGVDCQAIAKHHGGGGHVPAAGFSEVVDPGSDVNPYWRARSLLSAAMVP